MRSLLQKSILPHLTVISLTSRDYQNAFELTTEVNLSSGAIYDALHLVGARKSGCATLYTLNLRHFQLLAQDDTIIAAP